MVILIIPIYIFRVNKISDPETIGLTYFFMYAASCTILPMIYFLKKPRHFKNAMDEMFG